MREAVEVDQFVDRLSVETEDSALIALGCDLVDGLVAYGHDGESRWLPSLADRVRFRNGVRSRLGV